MGQQELIHSFRIWPFVTRPRTTVLPTSCPAIVHAVNKFYSRRDISAIHNGMVVLEYVASQLLNGEGLFCPYQGECTSQTDCKIRLLLAGIWRNTEPCGAIRWEKPACIE
jgi:hypothetical protein